MALTETQQTKASVKINHVPTDVDVQTLFNNGSFNPGEIIVTPDEDDFNGIENNFDLLWSYGDATISQAQQTISIPGLSQYNTFVIKVQRAIDHTLTYNYSNYAITSNDSICFNTIGVFGYTNYCRNVYVNLYDNTLVINNGYIQSAIGGGEVNNDKLIVTHLYALNRTPSMIYTGKELNAGYGINIDNGTISTNKWKTFIGEAGTENYLPINWNELSEISFRVLGSDQATFGYVHIPKELWHNNGAYILEVNCFNEYGAFKGAMWFEVIGKHETSTQIKATVKNSAQSGFTIAYR